jgi:hypothetical protein
MRTPKNALQRRESNQKTKRRMARIKNAAAPFLPRRGRRQDEISMNTLSKIPPRQKQNPIPDAPGHKIHCPNCGTPVPQSYLIRNGCFDCIAPRWQERWGGRSRRT